MRDLKLAFLLATLVASSAALAQSVPAAQPKAPGKPSQVAQAEKPGAQAPGAPVEAVAPAPTAAGLGVAAAAVAAGVIAIGAVTGDDPAPVATPSHH